MDTASAPSAPAQSPSQRDIDRSIMARLAAPFPADVVSWRPGSLSKANDKAQALAYIDARDVQNRLDQVLCFDWDMKHYPVGDDHVCCEITITLPGGRRVTRTNGCWVGNVEAIQTKDGKVEAKEEDRVDREAKWALSDAFKRAAVMFGVGKYLYDMPTPYMPINEFKRFSDETLAHLRKLAHKPFEDWQKAREERAKEEERAKKKAPSTAAAPPTPQEKTPSAAAAPPASSASEPPILFSIIAEAKDLDSEEAFHAFVRRTRGKFPEGSPERSGYIDAVKAAAKRLGVRPNQSRKQQ